MKNKLARALEKQLHGRLRLLGCALLVVSLGFFFYAVVSTPYLPPAPEMELPQVDELTAGMDLEEEPELLMFSESNKFNFYTISATFALLAAFCLIRSKKMSPSK
jgi:hypothetical protein